MVIGFDASRAFVGQKTGTENYSYELLRHLLSVDSENTYRIYLRPTSGVIPAAERVRDLTITAVGNPNTDPGPNSAEATMGKQARKTPINADWLNRPNVQIVNIKNKRLWTQAGLAWRVLMDPPDVLFVPAHTLPVIRRPNLKTVVTVHDLGAEFLPQYHQFPQKLYLNRSTEYAVKHATRLIAVSQATKEDLVKRLTADPNKISVVYEGYDTDHFKPQSDEAIEAVKSKYHLDKPYFLFVGTVQPRKNLERLIEAFVEVLKQKNDLNLVIAGKKGWLSDPIYEAPRRLGVEDNVHFLNYVDDSDLPGLYAGARAFVFPSLFEGFGIPILEAMACGTPVLLSNVSSMPEVGGEAATYFDPNSTVQIAEVMVKMLTDEKAYSKAKSGLDTQVRKFSWRKCATQTLDVLEETAK